MTYRLLSLGPVPDDLPGSAWGPFDPHPCATLDDIAQSLQLEHFDAVLLTGADPEALLAWPSLSHAVLDAGVVAAVADPQPAATQALLARGVQDVVPAPAGAETLARALRLAIERKRIEQAARKSYATDLATGLPNHQQLLEHMTHLLALREREPAPMALLAVRVEGIAATEGALGIESANVLRRKVAVRLRAALRASDVVAAIGADAFVVLLAWIDAPEDGERVAAKLARTLHRPFSITGHDVAVATSIGFSLYPEHGKDADSLLRRAVGQAAGVATEGGSPAIQRGLGGAANDDEA